MLKDLATMPVVLIHNLDHLPEVDSDISNHCPAPPPFTQFAIESINGENEDRRMFFLCDIQHRRMNVTIVALYEDNQHVLLPTVYTLTATEDWRWKRSGMNFQGLEQVNTGNTPILEHDQFRDTIVAAMMSMNATNMELVDNNPIFTRKDRINLSRGKLTVKPRAFYTIEVNKAQRVAPSDKIICGTTNASKKTHRRRSHLRRLKRSAKTLLIPQTVINAGCGKLGHQVWVL